jgi:hypothetical protein
MIMNKYSITFKLETYHSCCGIKVVHGFSQPEYVAYRQKATKLKSVDAILEKFYSDMLESLKNDLEYSPLGYKEGQVYIVQIVLMEGQLEELPPFLLDKGWTEQFNFKNANSGNKVTMYQVGLTPSDIGLTSYSEYYDEEDDEELSDW